MGHKNALLIGGSGGLSSVVAKKAMEAGYRVFAVTRGQRKLNEEITSIVADRNDLLQFERKIMDVGVHFDVVFDCICMNSEHAKQDIEVLSKVTGRLVVISTDSVYDPFHKMTPQTEEGVFIEEDGPSDKVSYGGNKRRMELRFLEEMNKENQKLNITIFRPGHIYGPGFLLGCFPENSRQADLPQHILSGKPVKLVGFGTYLIHPIYVDDLASVCIDCVENEKTYNEIFCIGGPESIENRLYYEEIAKALGVELVLEEVPLKGYPDKHPEYSGHLCHRIYDLTKLKNTGVSLPKTHLAEGIRLHLKSLGY